MFREWANLPIYTLLGLKSSWLVLGLRFMWLLRENLFVVTLPKTVYCYFYSVFVSMVVWNGEMGDLRCSDVASVSGRHGEAGYQGYHLSKYSFTCFGYSAGCSLFSWPSLGIEIYFCCPVLPSGFLVPNMAVCVDLSLKIKAAVILPYPAW